MSDVTILKPMNPPMTDEAFATLTEVQGKLVEAAAELGSLLTQWQTRPGCPNGMSVDLGGGMMVMLGELPVLAGLVRHELERRAGGASNDEEVK